MKFQPVPGLPHVKYAAGPDARGQWWIACKCTKCGPREDWQKPCSDPRKTDTWVARYGFMHVHQGHR
jgi:hypothetical protein